MRDRYAREIITHHVVGEEMWVLVDSGPTGGRSHHARVVHQHRHLPAVPSPAHGRTLTGRSLGHRAICGRISPCKGNPSAARNHVVFELVMALEMSGP